MLQTLHGGQTVQVSEESGRYFRYLAEFIGFTADDAETIRRTKPIIEKHVGEIVDKFYEHLLRHLRRIHDHQPPRPDALAPEVAILPAEALDPPQAVGRQKPKRFPHTLSVRPQDKVLWLQKHS